MRQTILILLLLSCSLIQAQDISIALQSSVGVKVYSYLGDREFLLFSCNDYSFHLKEIKFSKGHIIKDTTHCKEPLYYLISDSLGKGLITCTFESTDGKEISKTKEITVVEKPELEIKVVKDKVIKEHKLQIAIYDKKKNKDVTNEFQSAIFIYVYDKDNLKTKTLSTYFSKDGVLNLFDNGFFSGQKIVVDFINLYYLDTGLVRSDYKLEYEIK
jgi:hypothetical protein